MTRSSVVVDVATAMADVADGMTVAIGGFITAGHPMVLVRELIRSGRRELTIVGSPSAGLEVDLLIAAGCVRKVICPYVGAEAYASIGPAFKYAAEQGSIDVWECDEWMYYAGLRAAAQDLPYLPCRGLVGTSYPDVNPDLMLYQSPVGGETLIAVPAIRPDVALLHAAYADPFGNVQYVDTGFGDRALYNAAARTVVQVEQIVPVERTLADPGRTAIPYADAIVRAPFGAHPFASAGFYLEDGPHLRAYLQAARAAVAGDRGELDAYLDRFVGAPIDHVDYLGRVGLRTLLSLNEY
jgi:glutaconate CoA-transferase, subunit A